MGGAVRSRPSDGGSIFPVPVPKCSWNHRINGTAEHCCICIPGRACVERFVDLLAAPRQLSGQIWPTSMICSTDLLCF